MIDCYCLCCHKSLRYENDLLSMFYVDDVICSKCRDCLKYKPISFNLNGLKVNSLYPYDGHVRELLIQYKESKDEALFPIFLWPHINKLRKKYKSYTLIPVPSSSERNKDRGFKTVEEIFGCLNLEFADVLEKTSNVNQKHLHQSERHKIKSYIRFKDTCLHGKKILLVDDIVTTGETLKACYKLLKPHCKELKALTIAYTKR